MIRHVAFAKATGAGMAGAVLWEIIARPLILAGVPFADIVGALGSVALPESGVWTWLVGMGLHLLVGAIWAIFYAYFAWSVLTLRPVMQGIVFSFVPMMLAIFIMHPQLELMHPQLTIADPYSGFFGMPGGWHEPASIAVGHLIWGGMLGLLYRRPVGYAVGHSPSAMKKAKLTAPSAKHSIPATGNFMFATGIECSYPTLEGGSWRVDQMHSCGHYRRWQTDLALVKELGIRHLRYGPPLHLTFAGPGQFNWDFLDDVAAEMQALGIEPIMDLCHFGLPDWLGNFQNPEVPSALADYALAFAQRYPWIRLYTPVNEMYVCAKLSALEGLWNEQCRDERSFVTAVRHLARANVLMMQSIRGARHDAIFVNSESGEFFQPCCPEPSIQRIAAFENERRFLPLDLVCGRPLDDAMLSYLTGHGMPHDEYAWFMQQRMTNRLILGLDYYEWNEKLIDSTGRAQSLGELFGWYVIASQYYERYRLPIMHTETNRLDARDGPSWLWRQWHNVQLMRRAAVPIVGFTWYSLTDQVDWDIALREPRGNVTPVGLFDLNRDVRPVGVAYRHLIEMFGPALDRGTDIEGILAAEQMVATC